MKKKEIYLAGGCFWGVEAYFKKVSGVLETSVGYANGKTDRATYDEIAETGHSEAVKVSFDEDIVTLTKILEFYFAIINPISKNKQGNDIGAQYRTGIYYLNEDDKKVAERFVNNQQKFYKEKIRVEIMPLLNYTVAEGYHQNYLDKNPGGYCHIDIRKAPEELVKERRKTLLGHIKYQVTTLNATEAPFTNEYSGNFEKGIYVDIITGEPLFFSSDKFESGCGWPSFSRAVSEDNIEEKEDKSYGMKRIEVRSRSSNAHLGHLFDDGPEAKGGLRYCINSAALRFIPESEMKAEGYGELLINL